MANGRCYLHGGASLGGIASPRFKHGRYSRYLPSTLIHKYEVSRRDPDLLALRDDIALLDVRILELVERVDTSESGSLWQQLHEAHARLVRAKKVKAVEGMAEALTEIGDLIDRGADDYANWEEIIRMLDQRRRLVESERKRLVEMQQMITAERAMILVSAVVNAVARHVGDRRQLNAIATDIRGLIAGQGGLNAGGHDRARAETERGKVGAPDTVAVGSAVSDHPG